MRIRFLEREFKIRVHHLVCVVKISVFVLMTMLLVSFVTEVAQPFVGGEGRSHKQVSVRIEPGQVEIRKIGDFDWVTLPECSYISTQGHPALPIKSVVVNLPRNSEVVNVRVIKTASSGVPGKYRVAPAPKPGVVSDGAEVMSEASLLSVPLQGIYDSSTPYPTKLFDFYASKGRECNYVMIYLYPVKFVPLESELTLVSEATFDVEYTMEPEGNRALDDPSLDQVIITAPAYQTQANDLAVWRNATQVRTRVFTTSWIYSNYGGVDGAEKIRNFIRDMFNNTGIRYVVLFGDVGDVPTRFAYVPDGDEGPPDGILVPTDYYYECLDGTWDPNGDGKYANLVNDTFTEIDFIPEVSVGRLSVNGTTAGQVVNKIIQYEKNFDPAWFGKMILVGTNPFPAPGAEGEILKDYVQDVVASNFTSFTKLYETHGTLSPAAISENINLGSGAVNFAGHGNYSFWDLGGAVHYTNNNAASLTNGYKLPIVAAMACLTAGFDSEYNPGNCIGEEFLRNPNGGSVVYMGPTRESWGYTGSSVTSGLAGELDWRFWESYTLGITQPGRMLTEAKIKYIAGHPLNNTMNGYYLDEKTVLEYVLLGDPVLFVEKPSTHVETYKDLAYSREFKFFTVDDVVYVEADVRGYGAANISYADVYAGLYFGGFLVANVSLTHFGGVSSLYRGSWVSSSSSSVGVYLVNVTVSSAYESASGSNRFHLYSGSGVSAYRLDWDEDGMGDCVLESEHLISVFDGTEYTAQSMIYLYQKDVGVAYVFERISDADSVGRGEVTTSDKKGIKLYSFSMQEGENLASSYLEMRADVTVSTIPKQVSVLVIGDVVSASATLFKNVLTAAGYTVTLQSASATNPATWTGYDFLVWAASDDRSPINNGKTLTRDALVSYVNGGGRLIIEGGDVGYYANTSAGWGAFMSDVLHMYNHWFGDWGEELLPPGGDRNAELTVEAPLHPIRTIPNMLPDPIYFTFGTGTTDYGTADWLATTDGTVVYQWGNYASDRDVNYGDPLFGVMAYDDDGDVANGGQIVFMSFDIRDIDKLADKEDLIENAANWVVPLVTASFNVTVRMRKGSDDYLVYRLHDFDADVSDVGDVFSVLSGRLGSSVGDDRYHLADGSDWLITSLAAGQWNNYAVSNYVCVYDDSGVVLGLARFYEANGVVFQDVGLWNDAGYGTGGLRMRCNVSRAATTGGVSFMLVFTKGNWKTVDRWMWAVEEHQYPDPNFMEFPRIFKFEYATVYVWKHTKP